MKRPLEEHSQKENVHSFFDIHGEEPLDLLLSCKLGSSENCIPMLVAKLLEMLTALASPTY